MRVDNNYHIYEVSVGINERQPIIGQIFEADEWDETGTSFTHKIQVVKILDIKPHKNQNEDWYFDYTIKSYK